MYVAALFLDLAEWGDYRRKGEVEWKFSTGEGKNITIRSLCQYGPECKSRLLSPQRMFNKGEGVSGSVIVEEDQSTLAFDGVSSLVIVQ